MSEKEKFSSHLTRKEARLIKFFRLLPEEQRTGFAVEIEKLSDENETETISEKTDFGGQNGR